MKNLKDLIESNASVEDILNQVTDTNESGDTGYDMKPVKESMDKIVEQAAKYESDDNDEHKGKEYLAKVKDKIEEMYKDSMKKE